MRQQTRAAAGVMHPDPSDARPAQPERWAALKQRIAVHGLRNSLLVAIAPTATIASIAGCYGCIEPSMRGRCVYPAQAPVRAPSLI